MLRSFLTCLFFIFVSPLGAAEKSETYGAETNLSSWFLSGDSVAFWYRESSQRYRVSISSSDMPGYYSLVAKESILLTGIFSSKEAK